MKNKTKQLIVISAGDYAREVAWMAGTIPENCRDWVFAGFLDGRGQILDKYPGAGPILGNPESYEIKENDRFVCAIGSIDDLRKYAELIEKRGGLFANIIHPSALIGERTKIGVGCIVWPNGTITTDVIIGSHVSIHPNVVVSHDAIIGSFSILSAGSFVGGHARLDEEVFLKHGAVVPSRSDVQRERAEESEERSHPDR